MDIVAVIVSQYLAALKMLRQAVVKCPDSLWDDVADKTKFWHLDFCRGQVPERAPGLDMEAPSGFYWLPFNKLDLQLYNIRHIQQHTGELMERLGSRAGLELDWVGMGHD